MVRCVCIHEQRECSNTSLESLVIITVSVPHVNTRLLPPSSSATGATSGSVILRYGVKSLRQGLTSETGADTILHGICSSIHRSFGFDKHWLVAISTFRKCWDLEIHNSHKKFMKVCTSYLTYKQTFIQSDCSSGSRIKKYTLVSASMLMGILSL